jgi:hypothetical protein
MSNMPIGGAQYIAATELADHRITHQEMRRLSPWAAKRPASGVGPGAA